MSNDTVNGYIIEERENDYHGSIPVEKWRNKIGY